MIRDVRIGVLGALMLSIAVSVSAQSSIELSGFAGITPAVSLEQHALNLTDLRLRDGFTWGIAGAAFFTPHWGAEIVFSQQGSALEAVTPAGEGDLYGITVGQLHANVVYQFGGGDATWRPFVFGGAGATFFAARDLESATKASFGLGGGIKYFPWKTIGLTGQFRYKPTFLNDDPDAPMCAPFGFCQQYLRPIEISAGVSIRF
jgi:Outer membrane protein beta-barrel domain